MTQATIDREALIVAGFRLDDLWNYWRKGDVRIWDWSGSFSVEIGREELPGTFPTAPAAIHAAGRAMQERANA